MSPSHLPLSALDIELFSAYATASAAALWCLDYAHTISSEIDVLLSGNMTGTFVLYLINRYTFFGYIIVQVLQIIPGRMSQDACTYVGLIGLILRAISVATTNIIFALRLYAIFMRDRKVLYASAILVVPRVAINIFQIVTDTFHATKGSIKHHFGQCATPSAKHLDGHVISILSIVVPVLVVSFDLFVLVMTLKKTYRTAKTMRGFGFERNSLFGLIMRDGIVYFLLTLLIGIACAGSAIVSVIPGISHTGQTFTTLTSPAFAVFSNMLVNHLVLNLKTFSRRGCASDAAFSDAQYAENKFLGHIGAPLGGMPDGDMSPHAHEAWSELCEDGHDTEEGHTGGLPTWRSDVGSYGEAPGMDSEIAVSEPHTPSRVSSTTGGTGSRYHESMA